MPQPQLSTVNLSTPPPYPSQPFFDSPSTASNPGSGQYQFGVPSSRGGSIGTKADYWSGTNNSSTPPSPSTIDSYTDSQGGECFPPSDIGESTEAFRARALSQPTAHRRNNLSLSINNLPTYQSNNSPSTVASSSAPFTDTINYNYTIPTEYFQFEAPSAEEPVPIPPIPQDYQFGYRLPASQPSSPVRTIFPPGQAPFIAQPGRQRGATFSGTYSYFNEQFGGPLIPAAPSAIPSHLGFSQIQASPTQSPLLASPVILSPSTQTSYFSLAPAVPEVSMDDLATPTHNLPSAPLPPSIPSSRRSSFSMNTEVTGAEAMVEQLKIFDQMINSAQEAKSALLRGEDASANLGDLSHQLETVNELGARTIGTPQSASSLSPFQGTAPAPMMMNPAPIQMQQTVPRPAPVHSLPMLMTHQQAMAQHAAIQQTLDFQMSQPMAMPHQPLSQTLSIPQPMPTPQPQPSMAMHPERSQLPMINTSLTSSFGMREEPASAGYPDTMSLAVPPPLVHSHSFPNGHQLPSQLHAPVPTLAPSPNFAAALGIGHPPHVSSPLANVAISRPTSPRAYPMPDQPWFQAVQNGESSMARTVSDSVPLLAPPRRPSIQDRAVSESRADGLPVVNRGRSSSMTRPQRLVGMTSSVPPSAWNSRAASPEDEDDDDSEDEAPRKMKRRRSSAGNAIVDTTASLISEDMRRQLDRIFEEFLNVVCSDLEMVDAKGEKLHQVLMPKKMARLGESQDYRPFKFRIQAFTNSFADELVRRGITEETMSAKKIKSYLWKQDLISRFNADGKKAKSRGNHIWNVDAKKMPEGHEPKWVFRPFKRRIIGIPNPFAHLNQRYEYEPKIWDPQAATETIHPVFSSPADTLPSWMRWEEGKLVGVPTQIHEPSEIVVVANFTDTDGQPQSLSTSFMLTVVPPALMPSTDQMLGQYDVVQPGGSAYAQPYSWLPEYTGTSMTSQPIVPYNQAVGMFTGQQQPMYMTQDGHLQGQQ